MNAFCMIRPLAQPEYSKVTVWSLSHNRQNLWSLLPLIDNQFAAFVPTIESILAAVNIPTAAVGTVATARIASSGQFGLRIGLPCDYEPAVTIHAHADISLRSLSGFVNDKLAAINRCLIVLKSSGKHAP